MPHIISRFEDVRFSLRKLSLLLFLGLLSGCSSMVFNVATEYTQTYAEEIAMPYVMTTSDPAMGCAMGDAMTPALMSMETFNRGASKLGVMSYMSSALCAETQAREQELRYQRALLQGDTMEAQDARIMVKRAWAVAADRQYQAWHHLSKYYGEPGTGCPELASSQDELVWLLGLIGGLQAVNSDIRSTEGRIPRSIAARVERSAQCLESQKWWGVPKAIRATLWVMIPGVVPEGEDPWHRLQEASDAGEVSGVRLANIFHAMAAVSAGDEALVRQLIRDHAQAEKRRLPDPAYQLLDAMAHEQMLGISDALWTAATGKRTPTGAFGRFWDDKQDASETIDINDLL